METISAAKQTSSMSAHVLILLRSNLQWGAKKVGLTLFRTPFSETHFF